jgi:hypothetical protein
VFEIIKKDEKENETFTFHVYTRLDLTTEDVKCRVAAIKRCLVFFTSVLFYFLVL